MASGILIHYPTAIPVMSPSGPKLLKASNQDVQWPLRFDDGLAWDGNTLGEGQYTFQLTEKDKEEVELALKSFKSLGLNGSEVTRDTFHLPNLGPKLFQLAIEVHRGKGFVNIRGFNPNEHSAEDNVLLFLGISSYIGEKRARQDEDGNMLMHISNSKASRESQEDRPTRYSNRASTFHTDTFCDILALQTRSNAANGGRHLVASSATIYNKMAATRPDLLVLLAQPEWSFDSRGSLFDCNTRPLMYYLGGNLILNFAREPLLGLADVKRSEGLRETTKVQIEALDLIEKIARESQLALYTEPGDLTFINNHSILHSREAFEDAPGKTRHLVRMWLKNPDMAWKLPRELQVGNTRIYDDDSLDERWNIVDTPRFSFKLSERLTS